VLKDWVRSLLPTPLVAKARIWRLRRRIARYVPRIVTHRMGDFTLRIQLADELGEGWYDREAGELPEIAFLRRHRLRPGATVFDLGAHQCVVAIILAKTVGPTGRVIALEANKHNANVGQKNKELNDADNLRIVQAAAADQVGTLTFNEGLNGNVDDGTGQWGRTTVPARTIDDLAAEFGRPDVVFVDVEGYEGAVLRGATQTLQTPTDWFVEMHVGCGLEKFGESVQSIIGYFPRDRFDLLMAADTDSQPRPFKPDEQLTRGRFYLFAIGRSGEPGNG
jgi:FkbM family methyltransferase